MSTPSVTLLNSAILTGANQASLPLMIAGGQLQLDFVLVTTGGPTSVNWFVESSEDNANFFQECAEEDAGKGVVSMPKVVRTFADNNGTALSDGTHMISVPFERLGPIMRLQMNVSAGAATVTVTSPSGGVAR